MTATLPTRSSMDTTTTRPDADRRRVAFYLESLVGHGAEKMTLNLAGGLAARGYAVDLVVDKKIGQYVDAVPASLRVVELEAGSRWRAYLRLFRVAPGDALALFRPLLTGHKPFMRLWQLESLIEYLETSRPDVLIAALHFPNILAVWAREIARVQTRVIVTERSVLSQTLEDKVRQTGKPRRGRYRREFIARTYPRADAIVAVCAGAADDLATTAYIDRNHITTIYNPVVSNNIVERAAEPSGHPWLDDGNCPVILAVGRLIELKGFDVLIDAFSELVCKHNIRLVILGEGEGRQALADRIDALGLAQQVSMPGWVANPYAYMARAAVFVLSSYYEGLSGVLIEAMACGCSVVATDCPGGSKEILQDNRHKLVPPGDAWALARAIDNALRHPQNSETLQRRAADFSVESGTARYHGLIETLRAATREPSRHGPRT